MPTREELKALQALPLERKILITQTRIIEWYKKFNGQVYISFSGGKDSTVLLHLVRQLYPDIEAVFVDTGLEYPEIRTFIKQFDNVTILRPKMRFDEVIKKYGYPVISKEVAQAIGEARRSLELGKTDTARLRNLRGTLKQASGGGRPCFNHEKYEPLLHVDFKISDRCCKVMKKATIKAYENTNGKHPLIAQLACEGRLRKINWLRHGCNAFNKSQPTSNPLAFWTEQDILRYIKKHDLPIARVYGDIVIRADDGNFYENTLCDCGVKLCTTGCDRTGCIFCGFGAHLDKGESRFERLKRTHPRQYDYCMGGGAYDTDGYWKPTKEGLGMRHCVQILNEIYGKDFIRI